MVPRMPEIDLISVMLLLLFGCCCMGLKRRPMAVAPIINYALSIINYALSIIHYALSIMH
jgi:hypothetical protein